jgi:hypothetical protein
MSQISLESNVAKILELAQDLINSDDAEIVYFGNAIADNLRQVSIVINDYKATPSYDHSEMKEARHG